MSAGGGARGALLAALCLLAACGRSHYPNVVLLVVDTLRADRLGVYGNDAELTPFLDELAARGVVFRNAYAASSWTNPSVASLMTSRHQSQHQVLTFSSRLAAVEVTLAEVLRAHGYATAGFSANAGLGRGYGFSQGFEHYAAFPPQERPGPHVYWPTERAEFLNDKALAWLDTVPTHRPVFLYVQYMEPHTPYKPSRAALDHVFGAEHPNLMRINGMTAAAHLGKVDAEGFDTIARVYDAEVRDVDAGIRALLTALDERGFLDDTLVVVTSDHGEEFHDHGRMGHGKTLYDEVLRVPLIIVPPWDDGDRTIDAVAPLVDVAPTVLDVVGIRLPKTFVGRSLCAALGAPDRCHAPSAAAAPPEALSELNSNANIDRPVPGDHRQALVEGDRKLIVGFGPDSARFFDLETDPGEEHPDALSEDERVALRARLETLRHELAQTATEHEQQTIDEATRERLKALGYTD